MYVPKKLHATNFIICVLLLKQDCVLLCTVAAVKKGSVQVLLLLVSVMLTATRVATAAVT